MKNKFDNLKHIPTATTYLAKKLIDGNLVLFLGAGTSKGFGLPDWVTLVNSIRSELSLYLVDYAASAADLQQAADEVMDEVNGDITKLILLIEKFLYDKFDHNAIIDSLDNKLLIAISALLMGSKRGHVNRVVTLNYDSMLEWFLSLFGFIVKTIYSLPEVEGSEDVRIYHPHGYVPSRHLKLDASDFIILDRDSVNKRLGTLGDPWFEMVRHILNTGLCLFIGMSEATLTDAVLSPLLFTCGTNCIKNRPLGIWMIGKPINAIDERKYFRNNIVPLSFKHYDDYPEFLLKICQQAALTITT